MAESTLSEPILKGWISPCDGDVQVDNHRRELESLGVKVGVWDMFQSEFQECEVSLSALHKLDPLWGKYIWGLENEA